MCAGCSTSGEKLSPLSVKLAADCDLVLQPVMVPPVKAGDDARAALAKRTAALVMANRRLDEGRACEVNQRGAYARAK